MQQDPKAALDHMGFFVTKHLRDKAIDYFDSLALSRLKAPGLQGLQEDLASVPEEYKSIIKRVVINSIDDAIHNFLFNLQEQADFENRIALTVDGHNVVTISDGIQGEPYGKEGWYARFSAHGEKTIDM
jgi:hypothetical protein